MTGDSEECFAWAENCRFVASLQSLSRIIGKEEAEEGKIRSASQSEGVAVVYDRSEREHMYTFKSKETKQRGWDDEGRREPRYERREGARIGNWGFMSLDMSR